MNVIGQSQAVGQNPADLLKMIQALSKDELGSLVQAAQKEQDERRQKVKDVYGQWFCDLFGLERLYNLPEVPASQLALNDADNVKYPSRTVLPSHLKDVSAVRGVMGVKWPRPFVAVKIEILDPTTEKVVATVVELIFKRYSINGDGGKGKLHENNYVTALECTAANGETYMSNLYSGGGMSDVQVIALKDLLEGKTIKPPVNLLKQYLNLIRST